MNPIGIMQGRLSPPIGGRIQSFPVDTWREEFYLAREAGLDCIEWIYEADTEAANPLRTDEGVTQVHRLSEDSGVAVWSVCADYYMAERLVTPDGMPRDAAVEHLIWLVGRAGLLGVRYIVLPFVDESSLRFPQEVEALLAVLKSVMPAAEQVGVELHLETDLKPADLVAVLEQLSHPLVRANYDIGNSAALGHSPMEELTLLGPWLGSIHVKDRVLGDGTVPLGAGSADFPTCFRLIRAAGFRGSFILQAAREEGLSEVELAERNRRFVEHHLAVIASGSYPTWTKRELSMEIVEPTHIPSEWLEEFEAAARRPLDMRLRYAFIHTYKPVLDDAPYRAFDTLEDYRRWCQENLPDWLGYGRV